MHSSALGQDDCGFNILYSLTEEEVRFVAKNCSTDSIMISTMGRVTRNKVDCKCAIHVE